MSVVVGQMIAVVVVVVAAVVVVFTAVATRVAVVVNTEPVTGRSPLLARVVIYSCVHISIRFFFPPVSIIFYAW